MINNPWQKISDLNIMSNYKQHFATDVGAD